MSAEARYQYGKRRERVYPITETELILLRRAPFWVRDGILKRIVATSDFDGRQGSESP